MTPHAEKTPPFFYWPRKRQKDQKCLVRYFPRKTQEGGRKKRKNEDQHLTRGGPKKVNIRVLVKSEITHNFALFFKFLRHPAVVSCLLERVRTVTGQTSNSSNSGETEGGLFFFFPFCPQETSPPPSPFCLTCSKISGADTPFLGEAANAAARKKIS